MGQKSSKKESDRKTTKLTDEENKLIKELLNIKEGGPQVVTRAHILTLWETTLGRDLSSLFLRPLFPSVGIGSEREGGGVVFGPTSPSIISRLPPPQAPPIPGGGVRPLNRPPPTPSSSSHPQGNLTSLDDLIQLYTSMKSDYSDVDCRAKTIMKMIYSSNSNSSPQGNNSEGLCTNEEGLIRWVKEVLCSTVRVLSGNSDPGVLGWREGGSVALEAVDLGGFSRYLVGEGLPEEGEEGGNGEEGREKKKGGRKINWESIEYFLRSSDLIVKCVDALFDWIYNLKKPPKDLSLFPIPVFNPFSNALTPQKKISTLLTASDILFLNGSLPRLRLRESIVKSGKEEESIVDDGLGNNSVMKPKWRLLFSTFRDGESWATLVKRLSGQGPVLLILRDEEGQAFGGYASVSMKMGPTFYGDEDCFLFSLRPKMEIYNSSGYNTNYLYLNQGQKTLPNGLGFGGQFGYWGLYVDSEFGNGRSSESCTTFRDYKKLSLRDPFLIKDLECWGVGEPDPTPEELGERGTGGGGVSALRADPAAEAILEAAGKQFHSKGFKEVEPKDSEEE